MHTMRVDCYKLKLVIALSFHMCVRACLCFFLVWKKTPKKQTYKDLKSI